MTSDKPNPFVTFAKTEEAIGLAEGRASGQLLVEEILTGTKDAHAVADAMREQVLNSFDHYSLLGFAAALVDALREAKGS